MQRMGWIAVLLCLTVPGAFAPAPANKLFASAGTGLETRVLRGLPSAHYRHLAQLPPLPSVPTLSTATASATASASSNANGHHDDYPSFGECQTAAAAFAKGGSSPTGHRHLATYRSGDTSSISGRRLFSLQDYFQKAVAAANAAGAAFGSPSWQNAFIAACASQASSSAGGGNRKLHSTGPLGQQ